MRRGHHSFWEHGVACSYRHSPFFCGCSIIVAVAWLEVQGTERMQSGRQAWAACLCILWATVASNGMDRMICGLLMHSLIGEKDMTPLTQEAIRLQQVQERTAHWRQ